MEEQRVFTSGYANEVAASWACSLDFWESVRESTIMNVLQSSFGFHWTLENPATSAGS